MRHVDVEVRLLAAALLGCGSWALGCGNSAERRPGALVELHVDRRVVDRIASERALGAEQALVLAVEDALLAQHFSEREPPVARWIERVVLARVLLGELGEEAKARGPVTDAEIAKLSSERFWELDRPRMVQVVHAVVISKEENREARALAERIASAVASASSAAEFQAAASAVSAEGFAIKVEELPPVALDGRAVNPDRPPPAGPPVQSFDPEFAAAAHRLQRAGEISPVVRTAFGYHVLYLVRSIDPKQPALNERRALLGAEIEAQRAQALQTELLLRKRGELSPEQARSALAAMEGLDGSR